MMNIRPVSDLFDKFPEVEDIALRRGEAVFLTKEGYGHLVLMSLERYEVMVQTTAEERRFLRKEIEKLGDSPAPPFTDDPSSPFCTDIEAILDYADRMAEETDVRYTVEEVFSQLREHISETEKQPRETGEN